MVSEEDADSRLEYWMCSEFVLAIFLPFSIHNNNCLQTWRGKSSMIVILRYIPPLSLSTHTLSSNGGSALCFCTLLSWSANKIYRLKGLWTEIAFSSSDILAVTTISTVTHVIPCIPQYCVTGKKPCEKEKQRKLRWIWTQTCVYCLFTKVNNVLCKMWNYFTYI